MARNRYVVARSWRRRVVAAHMISETDPRMTRCGREIAVWPWRSYPRTVPDIILCMRCNPIKLDWESMRAE